MNAYRNYSIYILLIVTVMLFSGLKSEDIKLRVAVAANSQYVLEEIKQIYNRQTGVTIDLIIGSSGKLTTQIEEGAAFDILISADTSYPNKIQREGLSIAPPKIYGYGTLVLWYFGNEKISMDVVKSITVKKIAIANPRLAPYGVAATQALKNYNYYDHVQAKLVYGESLSQVSQYMLSRSVELAFTSKSIMLASELNGVGSWIEVPKGSYSPMPQSAVLIATKSTDKHRKLSSDFYQYLYSEKAKAIFKRHGYQLG